MHGKDNLILLEVCGKDLRVGQGNKVLQVLAIQGKELQIRTLKVQNQRLFLNLLQFHSLLGMISVFKVENLMLVLNWNILNHKRILMGRNLPIFLNLRLLRMFNDGLIR